MHYTSVPVLSYSSHVNISKLKSDFLFMQWQPILIRSVGRARLMCLCNEPILVTLSSSGCSWHFRAVSGYEILMLKKCCCYHLQTWPTFHFFVLSKHQVNVSSYSFKTIKTCSSVEDRMVIPCATESKGTLRPIICENILKHLTTVLCKMFSEIFDAIFTDEIAWCRFYSS